MVRDRTTVNGSQARALRFQAQAVMRQLLEARDQVRARHAEINATDRMQEATGHSALDTAITQTRTMLDLLDGMVVTPETPSTPVRRLLADRMTLMKHAGVT